MTTRPRPTRNATIASLAVLKVNSDAGADYIDNFVPFVAEAMRRATNDVVSVTDLHAALLADFGLDLPIGPLRTVLDRAVAAGYAVRHARMYTRDRRKLAEIAFSDVRDKALRDVAALVDRLVDHSNELLPEPWTRDEAEAALLLYLASRGTSLLAASAADIPIALPANSVPDSDFVLSSFIGKLHTQDSTGFEFLTTAVKGSVLASVLYFDDFGSITRRFANLDVYLDTGVLLQALGWLGPELGEATKEMFGLARDLGCRLLCFRETLRELDGILTFTGRYLRAGRAMREPVWGASEYLVNAGSTASDIDLMSLHLVDDLIDCGVAVRERPPHVVRLTVDEAGFEAMLRQHVTYRSDEPVRHDLDAITAIDRLRNGEVITRLEDAKALFVTGNESVARATTHFFREAYSSTSFAPLCMPAHQFGTLLWLKKPLTAPDLPTRLVIADALAGLNPPQGLWRQYVSEIERLEAKGDVQKDDFYLLRYTPAAKNALMGVTVGGNRPFLEGSVPEILQRVRAEERRSAEEEAANERDRRLQVEAQASRDIERAEAAAENRVAGVAEELARVKDREDSRQRRREANYQTIARRVAALPRYALTALLLVVSFVQLYSASPAQPFGPVPEWLPSNILVGVAFLLVGGAAIVSSLFDVGLAKFFKPIETRWAERLTARLRRAFGDDA